MTTTTTTTTTLTRQRCWVHLEREAAARCSGCTRFFCRECVTEHDGRLVCAGCLRNLVAAAAPRRVGIGAGARRVLSTTVRGGQLVFSLALAWFFFHLLGQWLLTSTDEFHEGTVWKERLFGGGSGSSDHEEDKTDTKNPGGKADKTDPGDDAPDDE